MIPRRPSPGSSWLLLAPGLAPPPGQEAPRKGILASLLAFQRELLPRARRSQEEPGGARRSQEEPGGARTK